MRAFLLSTVFLCLLVQQASAQNIIPRFETLGVNDGLSQSSVYAIFQDRAGYMWFGTADGLNRYDGAEVRIFRCADDVLAPGSSNYIRGNISEDSLGNIWYANETGIFCYERAQDKLAAVSRFPFARFQNTIFYNVGIRDGRLWLVNFQHGVFAFRMHDRSFEHYPFPKSFPGQTTANNNGTLMPNGDIVFSLFAYDGLVRFRAYDHNYARELPGVLVGAVCPGRGKAFIVSRNGYYCYDSSTRKHTWIPCQINGRPIDNIINILEDPYGRRWLTTTGSGLVLQDPGTGRFQEFRHDNTRQRSLPIDLLRDAYLDRQNNLWIGTDGGGVCRLDLKPPRFNLFPLNEGDHPALPDYFTKCFYEDRRGRIWFGGHNTGFSIFDPHNGSLRVYSEQNSALPGNIVGSIMEAPDSSIWIGHSMGFSRFDEATGRFYNIVPSPRPAFNRLNIYVYQMRALHDGRLLAATGAGIVTIHSDHGRYQARAYQSAAFSNQTTSVLETSPGDIWYTCPLVGLYHVKAEGDSFRVVGKYFPGIDMRCLHLDERDSAKIWLGSAKGLICLNRNTGRFQLWDTRHGMANAYIYGILEDEQHNFWLSTNGGLLHFDRQRQMFTNYTAADGLQSNEFNTNAYHKGYSGRFYFGGIKGFNWFDARAFRSQLQPYPPQAAITSILVNEQPLLPGTFDKPVRLAYGQNNLTFGLAALDFTRPGANKLQYRLVGWDQTWLTGNIRTLRYARLPPGVYLLSVRAINPDGLSSAVKEFRFEIAAPFWKTGWFIMLATIALLSAVVLVTRNVAQRHIRRRLRALEAERVLEAERNRISKDMHDEIGSGLTQIALLSELMQAQERNREDLLRDVGSISSSARRLVQNMGEIVWTLNPQFDSLENLLAFIREAATAYFEPFDIDLKISFPDTPPAVRLSNEERRNLLLVAKEAWTNAFKHGRAQRINIALGLQPTALLFSVHDDGRGMSGPVRAGANGLRNMEKRMLDIGGEFSIQSNSEGTTVTFTLPLK